MKTKQKPTKDQNRDVPPISSVAKDVTITATGVAAEAAVGSGERHQLSPDEREAEYQEFLITKGQQ